MEKRKPKIVNKKLRGEWAEMVFMVRATEHGLPVCRPWGESRSYDFVVGVPGRFVAVQVKSTTCELREGYSCSVTGHQPYPPGTFDFLAAYVVFEDAWYIIPAERILGMECIALHSKNSNYEEYREAWCLLDPDLTGGIGPIDIQGCAEDSRASGSSERRLFAGSDAFNSVKVIVILRWASISLRVFLRFPQASVIVHRLCTSMK